MFNNFMRAPLVIASIAAFGFLGSTASHAANATNTFDVTASIVAACTISAGNLAFGVYDPFAGGANDNTSTISVTCTSSTGYNVLLGDGGTGNVAARVMVNGANNMNYSLFRDAARTNNWGETIGTDTVTGTGSGSSQDITVYGRIPAGQITLPSGSYTDTILATVEY